MATPGEPAHKNCEEPDIQRLNQHKSRPRRDSKNRNPRECKAEPDHPRQVAKTERRTQLRSSDGPQQRDQRDPGEQTLVQGRECPCEQQARENRREGLDGCSRDVAAGDRDVEFSHQALGAAPGLRTSATEECGRHATGLRNDQFQRSGVFAPEGSDPG